MVAREEMLNEAQEQLIWIAVRDGAMKRSHLYKKGVKGREKKMFQKFVRNHCRDHLWDRDLSLSTYHLIDGLVDAVSTSEHSFSTILKGGELRYGNAQKFANLYLKYMWLMGIGPEPDHFPVDSIIQRAIGTAYPWTDMDKCTYAKVITEANKIKGNQSLARWEAGEYYALVNR